VSTLELVFLLVIVCHYNKALALSMVLGLCLAEENKFLYFQMLVLLLCSLSELVSKGRGCLSLKRLLFSQVSCSFFKYHISRPKNCSSTSIKQFIASISKIAK